ncbi:MAG: glutamate 5-kinase, partial [Planctomycetota bacterium]
MPDALRQSIVAEADPIVVKVGTRVLTAADGALDAERVAAIAEQVARLADAGRRVVLVSSGAVGAGIGRLALEHRPTDVAQLQAAAAVGQSRLIEAYNWQFERHGRHAAQVLLSDDDVNDRRRYLNIRNTLHALFRFGATPVVNQNDTVQVDELQRTVGDNDHLAAIVTNLLRAPLLVLLSDVDGLYDRPPGEPGATVIPTVESIDDSLDAGLEVGGPGQGGHGQVGLGQVGPGQVGDASRPGPQLSVGGMASKLAAARIATAAGENVIIAGGRRPNVLTDILAGEPVGTLLLAQGDAVSSRKRWIGSAAKPRGVLRLDAGACRAVVEKGSSLLPIGIVGVEGDFAAGDVVALVSDAANDSIAG